jgi:hypothetical protein
MYPFDFDAARKRLDKSREIVEYNTLTGQDDDRVRDLYKIQLTIKYITILFHGIALEEIDCRRKNKETYRHTELVSKYDAAISELEDDVVMYKLRH